VGQKLSLIECELLSLSNGTHIFKARMQKMSMQEISVEAKKVDIENYVSPSCMISIGGSDYCQAEIYITAWCCVKPS
jgi:hypothetical protein